MSYHIDASFRTVNDINYEALGLDQVPNGAQAPANGPKVKTFSVDGNDYRVTFADNGKVSVSFATTSFFHLFMGSSKTAVRDKIQELVDLNSFAKDVSGIVTKTSQSDNLLRTLTKETGTLVNAQEGKFAHYGFSNVRDRAQRGINLVTGQIANAGAEGAEIQGNEVPKAPSKGITMQLINDYNASIGLKDDSGMDAARTIVFVRDNNAGAWKYDRYEGYSKEDRREWCDHLKGKDVDLFSKIRVAKEKAKSEPGVTTGWAGEINRQGLDGAVRDMVRKNLDPRFLDKTPDCNFLISGVAKAVIEVAEMETNGLSENEVREKIKEIVAKHAPIGRSKAAFEVFNIAAVGAFWRQTSKLGLDFFRQRGEPIVFEWTQFSGAETDGAELQDKWWKNGDEDLRDHRGAAITNSEMRHVLKWEKDEPMAGGNSVIKVNGGRLRASVEDQIKRNVDGLRNLPDAEIRKIATDLTTNLEGMKVSDFYGAAEHVLMALPSVGWLDNNSKLTEAEPEKTHWTHAVEHALDRVKTRIETVKSPTVKAAMLMNVAALFEAELSKDSEIVEMLDVADSVYLGEEEDQPAPADVVCARRLAGLDRGRGMDVFFAPDTGLPNALGALVLAEAGGDVQRLADVVSQLKNAFADKFGCQSKDAFVHPAFRSYLVRAASKASQKVETLIGMLDLVKSAYDAKVVVEAHLSQLGGLPPKVQSLYDRRGNWDLDRLVFNEVQGAKKANRPVDFEKLRRDAAAIRDICAETVKFVDEISEELGADLQLDEDERKRLADSYLDREGSAVNTYRLKGSTSADDTYKTKYQEILVSTKAQVRMLRELSQGKLPAKAFKSLVISGVAFKAADSHFKIALAAVTEALKGGPLAVDNGATNAVKAESAIRALADRVREAILNEHETSAKFGYDDVNTLTSLYFRAYLAEDSALKAIFDKAASDPDAMNHIRQINDDYMLDDDADDVIKHLFDVASQYGTL